jgi:hypothetical protein
LIANLQATYDAAVANHSAFASATLAISLSRTDVKKIYDEYTANQTKLTEFANKPKPVSKYVAPQKPPVADGRQEQLNNQARSIMFGLSGEIIQARTQITKPALYTDGRIDNQTKNDSGPQYVAPPIPPIQTFDPGTGSPHSSGSGTPHQPTSTQPAGPGADHQPTQPGPARQPGLVLGGTQPVMSGPPSTGITVSPPVGGGGLPGTISPTPVLPTPPLGSTPPGFPSSTGTRLTPGEGPGRSVIGGLPNGSRPMPPGGVIGGTPGVGLGQPRVGGRAPSRVNPVGGVINPENSARQPSAAGRGGMSSSQPITTGGRSATRREEAEESMRWDPDNPWETAEGVAPVVLPATEQRVVPGPAIGLP